MTVPVIDLNDPEATHPDITVDVVTSFMLRHFLTNHLSFSFIAPVVGQGDWASLRFAELWSEFVSHRLPEITRAVRAYSMEYNPALTYFKHEHGDTDKIEYGRTNVTNSGGLTESTASAGKTGTASMGAAGEDGYREMTVSSSTSTGNDLETTTHVSTYDSETEADLTTVKNSGDSVSVSGSAQSSKSSDTGTDTHSRDFHIDGSDALHTTVDMVQAELEMRLHNEIGDKLLNIFAAEFLFLLAE